MCKEGLTIRNECDGAASSSRTSKLGAETVRRTGRLRADDLKRRVGDAKRGKVDMVLVDESLKNKSA